MSLALVSLISIVGDTHLLCLKKKSIDRFLCPCYNFVSPINLHGITFDILLLRFSGQFKYRKDTYQLISTKAFCFLV